MSNNIEANIQKLIERYLIKYSPEGITAKVRDTGYSYRLDYYIQMDDLISGRLNKIDTGNKLKEFNDDLVSLVNNLFGVNIMNYGGKILVEGEKQWIDSVLNKEVKKSFKYTEGSECIASVKVVRDLNDTQYDIVFGLKQNCKPTMCSWYECNQREENLKILGNNLRETLDTFNFPEGLFKINLGGRYVSSSYEF
jgi:hypothetical protein